MLILLPPSEGKAIPTRGKPLDWEALSFPELNDARRVAVDALGSASARPDALEVLHAPAGAGDRVAANVHLLTAPTVRAGDLYTGVLYDALDLGSLDTASKRRAARRLVTISAVFGALRIGDRVPSYRCSMDVDLPGVGKLAAHWRAPLNQVLPDVAGRGVIVDMRSSTYVAAWRPTGPLAERTVAVQVVRDGPGGRTAVSHMAKHTRGLVARHLVARADDARTPEQLTDLIARDFKVDLDDARGGRPRTLQVVEP